MLPMKLSPGFKDYLWGGARLVERFGKQTPLRPVAESWEVSCYPEAPSIVSEGRYKGKTLADALAEHPEWLGTEWEPGAGFPILVKLIDAAQDLSVQVHPDDAYATRVERQMGKNEMWYVIDALPGTCMVLGCKEGVTVEDLRRSIREGSLLRLVNLVPVKAGDCFQIPAGLLHAIGGGALVAEVQQNSNVTYRVFDYGREDHNGRQRPLQVEQALEVVHPALQPTGCAAANPARTGGTSTAVRLTDWNHFTVTLVEVDTAAELACGPERFQCLLSLKGTMSIEQNGERMSLKPGLSVFVPAGCGAYRLTGWGTVLLITTS